MRVLPCLVLCFALFGCGGGDDSSSKPSSTSSEQASESSAASSELGMKDVCPAIEDALPAGFDVPVSEFNEFGAELETLRGRADAEAQNAIELAQPGLTKLVEVLEAGETGLFASEGEEAFLDGMSKLSDRCRAAGSSALQ